MQARIPVIVPPTMLILTELAPPPKKRVTINVAKFGAVAEGMSQICSSRMSQWIERLAPMHALHTYEKQNISAKVARHTTRVLRQRYKEQREDRSADVPRSSCPV